MTNWLDKILDFLLQRVKDLPAPLRSAAYFIFLAFFCATAWRLIAGQYVVRGVVWDGDEYATSCEVRLRGDYFSTNSKGMYYAILSPVQYYRFALQGSVDLPLTCKKPDGHFQRVKGPFKVPLNLWDDEFEDIRLDMARDRGARTPDTLSSFSLIPAAYAQEVPSPQQRPPARPPSGSSPRVSRSPSPGDRLVVERIALGKFAEEMREVEFEIDFGSKERPLLLEGSKAGKLRLKKTVNLGKGYYFDVSQLNQGARVSIEIEASGLFGNEEKFRFHLPSQYGSPFIVPGTQGSTLIVRLVPRDLVSSP